MAYTYKYPRPAVTADCVVMTKEAVPQVLLIETGLKHHPRQRLTKEEVDALNSLVYARTDLIKITSVLSQKADEGASFSSPPALACQHHYAFHLFTCVHCMRWKRSVLRKLLAL